MTHHQISEEDDLGREEKENLDEKASRECLVEGHVFGGRVLDKEPLIRFCQTLYISFLHLYPVLLSVYSHDSYFTSNEYPVTSM